MERAKSGGKYSLRGRKKADDGGQNQSRSSGQHQLTTASTMTQITTISGTVKQRCSDENDKRNLPSPEANIFDSLIKQAMTLPVQLFNLPNDYQNLRSRNNGTSNRLVNQLDDENDSENKLFHQLNGTSSSINSSDQSDCDENGADESDHGNSSMDQSNYGNCQFLHNEEKADKTDEIKINETVNNEISSESNDGKDICKNDCNVNCQNNDDEKIDGQPKMMEEENGDNKCSLNQTIDLNESVDNCKVKPDQNQDCNGDAEEENEKPSEKMDDCDNFSKPINNSDVEPMKETNCDKVTGDDCPSSDLSESSQSQLLLTPLIKPNYSFTGSFDFPNYALEYKPALGLTLYPDPVNCDETYFIVLIQEGSVTVLFKNKHLKWGRAQFLFGRKDDPTSSQGLSYLKYSTIDSGQFIWIVILFKDKRLKDLNLIWIKFDKIKKSINTELITTFALPQIESTPSSTSCNTVKCQAPNLYKNLINITCLTSDKSALTLPGPNNSIDIFLYDLPTSSQIHLITLSSAKDITTSCLLPVNDWDETLFAHFDNRIFIWNINDQSLITTLTTERSVFENKICFNVLYDKGLIYLFIGSSRSSAIKVIALNPKTRKYATLLRCNFSPECPVVPITVNYIKLKRIGNQLIIIRNNEVILFDIVTNKTVLKLTPTSPIRDASIGFISDKPVIFGATDTGHVINLLNS